MDDGEKSSSLRSSGFGGARPNTAPGGRIPAACPRAAFAALRARPTTSDTTAASPRRPFSTCALPMSPVQLNESLHRSTWHSISEGSSVVAKHSSCWRPLGYTWREWETQGLGRTRNNVDESQAFIHGCVPNWGKEANVRMRDLVAHEFNWAYYHMSKHPEHPLRRELGETLPRARVHPGMRAKRQNTFRFWLDVRPPFTITKMKRVDNDGDRHPDGELYKVNYQCGIEYASEHLKDSGANGVYDNVINGVATVRIPDAFPQRRPIIILSWGRPALDSASDGRLSDDVEDEFVDPTAWMPIGTELGKRPDDPALAEMRQVSMEASGKLRQKPRGQIEVPELQKLLLGPSANASLYRLARAHCPDRNAGSGHEVLAGSPALRPRRASSAPRVGNGRRTAQPPTAESPTRARKRTICTAAAGFVTYAG